MSDLNGGAPQHPGRRRLAALLDQAGRLEWQRYMRANRHAQQAYDERMALLEQPEAASA